MPESAPPRGTVRCRCDLIFRDEDKLLKTRMLITLLTTPTCSAARRANIQKERVRRTIFMYRVVIVNEDDTCGYTYLGCISRFFPSLQGAAEYTLQFLQYGCEQNLITSQAVRANGLELVIEIMDRVLDTRIFLLKFHFDEDAGEYVAIESCCDKTPFIGRTLTDIMTEFRTIGARKPTYQPPAFIITEYDGDAPRFCCYRDDSRSRLIRLASLMSEEHEYRFFRDSPRICERRKKKGEIRSSLEFTKDVLDALNVEIEHDNGECVVVEGDEVLWKNIRGNDDHSFVEIVVGDPMDEKVVAIHPGVILYSESDDDEFKNFVRVLTYSLNRGAFHRSLPFEGAYIDV